MVAKYKEKLLSCSKYLITNTIIRWMNCILLAIPCSSWLNFIFNYNNPVIVIHSFRLFLALCLLVMVIINVFFYKCYLWTIILVFKLFIFHATHPYLLKSSSISIWLSSFMKSGLHHDNQPFNFSIYGAIFIHSFINLSLTLSIIVKPHIYLNIPR